VVQIALPKPVLVILVGMVRNIFQELKLKIVPVEVLLLIQTQLFLQSIHLQFGHPKALLTWRLNALGLFLLLAVAGLLVVMPVATILNIEFLNAQPVAMILDGLG
jgi:hypothetical protein